MMRRQGGGGPAADSLPELASATLTCFCLSTWEQREARSAARVHTVRLSCPQQPHAAEVPVLPFPGSRGTIHAPLPWARRPGWPAWRALLLWPVQGIITARHPNPSHSGHSVLPPRSDFRRQFLRARDGAGLP
jgi:hypothetical protein